MRRIEPTSAFKADFKREAKGRHRDCHVKPDLVSIYRKPDADTLQSVRFCSHSELAF